MDGQGVVNTLLFLIFLMFFAYISRELENWRMISEIEAYLSMFKIARDRALSTTINTFKEYFKGEKIEYSKLKSVEDKLKDLVEVTIIEPTSLDPYGIVKKIKHIILTTEETIEKEVRGILSKDAGYEIKNLIDLIDATRILNLIYKIVNHYYRIARKFKSLWLLMQVYSLLPFMTEEVKALESSVEAFNKGLPIGDSVGPMIASILIRSNKGEIHQPVKDTIVSKLTLDEREIILIKAKGPGGTTGRLDDALNWVIKKYSPISMIITVDAALKLEGEESGAISHGFGVAIGGTGVEKFNIEEIATANKIPLYAILIKMSEIESLSIMDKKLYDSARKAIDIIRSVINERSNKGERIVIIGVGNTVGVYP